MTNPASKIWAAATREYKATALTWAFFLGAVVFPAVIWGAILLFSVFAGAIAGQREPLSGTIAIYDRTQGDAATEGVREVFDPRAQIERRLRQFEQVREALEQNPAVQQLAGGDTDAILEQMERRLAQAEPATVDIDALPDGADLDAARERVREGDLLALLVVDERSLALPAERMLEALEDEAEADDEAVDGDAEPIAEALGADEDDRDGAERTRETGEYEVYHSVELDPEYLEQIKGAVHRAIQDERYRRLGIEPDRVLAVAQNAPRARARLISETGRETESASGLQEFLPFIFLFLMYGAVLTGGNYLLMGTLEEKQSRVMEVLLSAVSPWQLLIGKMIGQALVGATVFAIYGGVGLFAAERFGVIDVLPNDPLSVAAIVLYFVMAYLFLGAMMSAVGSAVTEFREAQALYPPITVSLILPFFVLIAIMENPSSIVGRIFSFFPPTTPFVMVMRLSNPAYPVPAWEVLATLVVGFAGVAGMVALAARIFRVGVLSYGKPPSLLGLLTWARQG